MSEQTEIAAPPAPRPRRFSAGRLIDDFIVLATGQFLSKVLGFFAFAWLARILTVEDYGAVETAVGMAAIGAVALELGTGAVGVRRIAQGEETASAVLGAVIAARMMLAVVIAPLLAVAWSMMTAQAMPDLLFWLFAASLVAVPFNHNWFFQSQEKMAIAGFGLTLKMATFLLAIHVLRPQQNGVLQVGYAELVAALMMAFWYAVLAHRTTGPARLQVAKGAAALRESAPLGASAFVNTLAQQLPLLIVASLSTAVEAAQFGAAQRLVVSLITFSFVYYFNLYPLIARLIAGNPAALAQVIAASVRVTAWIGVLASALLCSLAPFIMRVVFGKGFETAGREFEVLVWAGALILASGNARWLLVAGKRQNSLLWAQCANAAVVIGLGVLLTPALGGYGAAIAAIVGALALWGLAHARTKGLAVRPPLADNLPAAVAALAVILMLIILKPGLWIGAVASLTIVCAGMALDRRFFAAVRVLAASKSVS